MEQIQKHEWVSEPGDWLEECAHCKTQRQNQSAYGWYVPGNYVYRKSNIYNWEYEQPACITRPINAPASDKAE